MKQIKALFLAIFVVIGLAACADTSVQPVIVLDGDPAQTLSMYVGQELALSANECADPVWSSSDPQVVEVEQDGYLNACAEGTATVTLTSGKQTASVEITVGPYIAVEEVMSKSDRLIIKAGGKKTLQMRVLPENASDKSLVYTVEPADGVLKIENGVVYADESAVAGTVYQITATNNRSTVTGSFQIEISDLKGLTAWTIGDSIFDFRDNSDTDMVQTILTESGYTNFYMDNIAGATIRAASSVGIVDHIGSGMYEAWPEPELIVLFRGTNDCYFGIQQSAIFTPESVEQAVKDTCVFFSENYPDARIVWATPLWRVDVPQEKLDWMRDLLHEYCPQYGIEVFDLHLTEQMGSLSEENFGPVLYDGIHLTDLGASYLKEAFIAYLNDEVS